jgi:threonine/homoserine/homoserine lactone efflux protein
MTMGALSWLYRKLRGYYPFILLAVELQSAFPIAAGTVLLFSFYYEAPTVDYLIVGGIVLGLTAVAVVVTLARMRPRLRPIERWIRGARGPQETEDAWRAGINVPVGMVRLDTMVPILLVVIPAVIAAVVILGAPWPMAFPIFVAGMVALGYSAILHYLILEAGLRPVLVEISAHLPPQHRVAHAGLPLRVRLLATMPMINVITAFVVVASPGTGVIYTLAVALGRGGAASVSAAVGCTLGILPHMAAAILGLAALMHTSAVLFQIVKFAGVLYLLWMAWSTLKEKGLLDAQPDRARISHPAIVRRGVVLNILNPKLSIFFLAFLPQFVPADAAAPTLTMVWLAFVFMAMTFVIFAVYGLMAASVRERVLSSPSVLTWMRRGFAAAFAYLGLRLALSSR